MEVPPNLRPIIRRTWDRFTGEFKWIAEGRHVGGWVNLSTPAKALILAQMHANKLNDQEKEHGSD